MLRKKNNSITEAELFAEISRRSNYLPEETVKQVYYGMVKAIVEQFRNGRDCELPGLGSMYVIRKPAQRVHNLNKGMVWMPEKSVIEFRFARSLKEYVNSIRI